MDGSWSESIPIAQLIEQLFHLVQRDVDRLATRVTDEVVMVGLFDEMNDSGTVSEMHVMQPPEIPEHVERAVDGGLIDLNAGPLDGPSPDVERG